MKTSLKLVIGIGLVVALGSIGVLVYRKAMRPKPESVKAQNGHASDVLNRVPRDAFAVVRFQAKRAMALPVWAETMLLPAVQEKWRDLPVSCVSDGTTNVDEVVLAVRGAGRDKVQMALVTTGTFQSATVVDCLRKALPAPWVTEEAPSAGRWKFSIQPFAWANRVEWSRMMRAGSVPTYRGDPSEQWSVWVENGRMVVANTPWMEAVTKVVEGGGDTAANNAGLAAASALIEGDPEFAVMLDAKGLQSSAPALWGVVPWVVNDLPGAKTTGLGSQMSLVTAGSATISVQGEKVSMAMRMTLPSRAEAEQTRGWMQGILSALRLEVGMSLSGQTGEAKQEVERASAQDPSMRGDFQRAADRYAVMGKLLYAMDVTLTGDAAQLGLVFDVKEALTLVHAAVALERIRARRGL